MEVEISKEVDKKLEEVSKLSGLKKREVVERALKSYLENLKKFLDMKKEFDMWERASDEDWAEFEKLIWKKEKSG